MTLMALTAQSEFDAAPYALHTLVAMALESIDDGRDVTDINMVLGVAADTEQGRTCIRHVMTYQYLDSLICFGETAEAAGLPAVTAPIAYGLQPVRFRQQLQPVEVVCLPAIHDPIWQSNATVFNAACAIKALLTAKRASDMIRPEVVLALENRELN